MGITSGSRQFFAPLPPIPVPQEKYGFNKQTLRLFFMDEVKSFALAMAIGLPVLYAVLTLIRWGGELFWLYVWVFLLMVSLVMLTIYPIYIAPLFNKFTPLEEVRALHRKRERERGKRLANNCTGLSQEQDRGARQEPKLPTDAPLCHGCLQYVPRVDLLLRIVPSGPRFLSF
jgi:hypothetical protein